jgi:hypothetical protein
MNTKTKIAAIIVLVFSFLATFFIIKSNDHKKCNTLQLITKDENGNLVTSQKHICKEKYSF